MNRPEHSHHDDNESFLDEEAGAHSSADKERRGDNREEKNDHYEPRFNRER
jgi:hypothetical protein